MFFITEEKPSLVGIFSQCIGITNHPIVHFKYNNNFICQLYLNEAEKNKEKNITVYVLYPVATVSLGSFNPESSSLGFVFCGPDVLKNTGQLIDRMPLNLGVSHVSSWLDLGNGFLAGVPQK